jgi:hypothetical protein
MSIYLQKVKSSPYKTRRSQTVINSLKAYNYFEHVASKNNGVVDLQGPDQTFHFDADPDLDPIPQNRPSL